MFKTASYLCFLLVMFVSVSKAQLLDSLALDTLTAYTDLQTALKEPDKVVKLVLRKQKFKEFPLEILKFKNLQYLDISKNVIKELPDSIDQLSNLQYLICSKTGLERIPKQIGKLKKLRYLNCNQNELESFPPQIGDLESLVIMDMWSNNLADFPETLANLKKLKVLDLRNILMSDELQNHVQAMLPNTKVYMSPSCKCKW
ncbi:MAG: leucine-rich repeat domain-containing protein [Bacteroidetes bacterium]|nr:leucine-rich repeat domain-containing protein [Bacteroidota bacterium]